MPNYAVTISFARDWTFEVAAENEDHASDEATCEVDVDDLLATATISVVEVANA